MSEEPGILGIETPLRWCAETDFQITGRRMEEGGDEEAQNREMRRANFSFYVIEILLCSTRGSLLTRSLADIVKKEDFVLNSEYLVTLLVVVPK